VTLVRPLLTATRYELRVYLAEIGQAYRDDATNQDLSQTRARIREDLLPKLMAEYNPRVRDALARLACLAQAQNHALSRSVRQTARRVIIELSSERVMLDPSVLGRLDPYTRAEVLRVAWRRAGWPEAGMSAARWARLGELAGSGRGTRRAIGAGVEIKISSETIVLMRCLRHAQEVPGPSVRLPVPGEAAWGSGRVIADIGSEIVGGEQVDLESLALPLVVRAPEAGDRFDPLGLGGRTQPLNDFFRGRGVAKADRTGVPLVCDARGIVWVVGHRIAHRVRRTELTRASLNLRWTND
jgi:tRNA(Ile)-lysidine synthase